jgi:translation initiation factor 1
MQKNRIVYSTDGTTKTGRMAAGDDTVRVSRERSGRRGKTVTLIVGVPGSDEARRALAANLKKTCGSGGTVDGDTIEIQGDHRESVAEKLRQLGYRVKLAGG